MNNDYLSLPDRQENLGGKPGSSRHERPAAPPNNSIINSMVLI
jgi:hypothetical protein